jgi:polyphosphate kinase
LPAGADCRADGAAFVPLEEIIRAHLPQLFPGQTILQSTMMRLARDAELEFDDEGGRTQLELVERELKRRRRSDVVRLELEASLRPSWSSCLRPGRGHPTDRYAVQGPSISGS